MKTTLAYAQGFRTINQKIKILFMLDDEIMGILHCFLQLFFNVTI